METNKKIEVLEKSDNERKSSVEDLKCEVEQIVLSSDEIEKIRKESRIDIVKQDPYLNPYQDIILKRLKTYKESILEIEKNEKSLVDFAKSHERIGIFYNQEDKYVHFTEYAPGAKSISIFGDFNYWNRDELYCEKDQFGFFNIKIAPYKNDKGELVCRIPHNSRYKIRVEYSDGKKEDRNPAYAKYLVQNKETILYDPVFWNPDDKEKYVFKNKIDPKVSQESPLIYEVHIGLSSEDHKVSTYKEFTKNVLPRIKDCGYNTIQCMAIMEHAYYGSFGYHVTNFFAASSRFGTPEDLKELIDTAHGMGIQVLIDLVHSHASTNVLDGINNLDGTDHLYFHSGARGKHELWDSRCFDYAQYETKRFLLSNLHYFLTEYQFDGFRFDGITSMIYIHHGLGHAFVRGYDEYFGDQVDEDALVYLMMANTLIKQINPNAISIAEDVSGMPGLCRPIVEGGIGFDYRLNMSVPDVWIKYLKEKKDEDWDMSYLVHTLTNRRWNEKHIGYCESHDQSIVGDKTISMWLFDSEIYYNMSLLNQPSFVVDRGMALHKMIRLITIALGGEGYLNFIGNEFGHPEWVDFPRDGNGHSYNYCRRQWSLADNTSLRFSLLLKFDNAMIGLHKKYNWLQASHQFISLKHEDDKLIVFEKGNLLFIFNFHPEKSFPDYKVGTHFNKPHEVVLSSDDVEFGGKGRVSKDHIYQVTKEENWYCGRQNSLLIYIPNRTAIVLKSDF